MTRGMRWTVVIALVVVAVSVASIALLDAARPHSPCHVLIGPAPVHTVLDASL